MAYFMNLRFVVVILFCWVTPLALFAQDPPPDSGASDSEETTAESQVVTGVVEYRPQLGDDEKLRDPFKSPFEIEEEEKQQNQDNPTVVDRGEVEQYDLDELDLRGIYLDARSGYHAIFKVGDEFIWYQVGTKFRDGDLENITDSAVIFKFYTTDDITQSRDLVKELHRGEE